MACDLSILLTVYDETEKKMKQVPVSLNEQVGEDETITIDRVVKAVTALSPDQRQAITNQLANAKQQNITNTMLKGKFQVGEEQKVLKLIGNTTLGDLLSIYPTLAQTYNIKPELYDSYTIIRGSNVTVNNVSYNGRAVTDDGQEVFFIKNYYSAVNFIKYLQAKEKAKEVFSDEGTVPESIAKYMDDLKLIAQKKKLSLLDAVIEYLNDRDFAAPFRSNNRTVTPRLVLGNTVSALTDEYNYDSAMTDLEIAISGIKSNTTGYDWKLPKEALYRMIEIYSPEFAQQFSLDNFREMSASDLQSLFTGTNGLFQGHPKLGRAKVKSETRGSRTITQPDEPTTLKTKKLSKDIIKKVWDEVCRQAAEAGIELPKKYQEYEKLDPESMSKIFNSAHFQFTPDGSEEVRTITTRVVEDKNGKKRVEYNYEQLVVNEPKVKETASYITLTFPYSLMGDIYNFGYKTQYMFAPVTEGDVIGGRYGGMFVYKASINGRPVYAISRSLISPKSYMATFPTLESAIEGIKRKQETDKIGANGLIKIKQYDSTPREATVELSDLQEGQILTTLDIRLPKAELKSLPNSIRQMFDLTVPEFQEMLKGIKDINLMNTPEKAAAFIIKASQLFNREEIQQLRDSKTITNLIALLNNGTYEPQIDEIIKEIDSAPMKHYYVEKLIVTKESKNRSRSKIATLKYLNNGGTDINIEGTMVGDMSIDEFIGQTVSGAIDFFNTQFGINITSMTSSELEQFSQDHKLGFEKRVDSIKAFIYDGNIYINTSNAKSSDLFHEVSHIFLGVLKAEYPKGYQQIMEAYQAKDSFKRKLKYISKNYKNFAMQDILEEAVVDTIADEMMRDARLSIGFDQGRFTEIMQNIINTVDSFKQDMVDNGLGFNDFMKSLMDKHAPTLKKQRILTEFIHQALANKTISEVNC